MAFYMALGVLRINPVSMLFSDGYRAEALKNLDVAICDFKKLPFQKKIKGTINRTGRKMRLPTF